MSKIEVLNLSKHFGKSCALKSISFTLEANKIYGLLGRNGAGKTTIVNIIANKYFADCGEVLLDGEKVCENDDALSKIHHMTDGTPHPREMKLKDAFIWAKVFYPSFDTLYANDLSGKFSLDLNKKVKTLSTGYQSVFKLILTLASNVPFLFFDEPVLGLDANFRELFYKELIANYSEKPKTIVISTHLIDEIADILEEVIIIEKGEVILAETVDELLGQAYSVSGDENLVDEYLLGKNVIREESLSRLKTATIFQPRNKADDERITALGLDTASIGLQELFVALTNSNSQVIAGERC